MTSIPANRAYLPYTLASGVKTLTLSFDDNETGIEVVSAGGNKSTGIYNLSGQRVTNPKHGIFIVNGKKVFIP